MTDKGLISHIYKGVHTTQHKKKKLKQPNYKNGQKIWIDNFPERICTWPTYTHEKMLNIISHQGNANQNHIWFVRMAIIKKYINEKCWWGCKEKGTLFKLVEQDMHSSSPARAPKLQLAIEQPLTGGCWNPPKKRYPLSKDKEEASVRW